MRALSDKWNPRLRLRDWLNRPSHAELNERRAAEAASAQMYMAIAGAGQLGEPGEQLSMSEWLSRNGVTQQVTATSE